MLNVLRRIVQEINAVQHFGEALDILVKRVREAIATEACSVFLIDRQQQEYVLLATDGLNPNAVGQVRLKLGEGLVGLVGQREEPINLEDAPSHPNFFYSPEVCEERYKAFLGVPIIHHRELLGVLIVQQEQKRRFDEAEEAFLITISAQLGGVIAHAEVTGNITRLLNRTPNHVQEDITLRGIPCSPGIGIGIATVVYPLADLAAIPDRKTHAIASESKLFSNAIAATRADIRALETRLIHALPPEENALFEAYQRILDSASLESEVQKVIRQGNWAQGALRKVIMRHARHFESIGDGYLRERASDLRDLGRRILMHLQSNYQQTTTYPEQTILISDEVSASVLADIPEERLAGIVARRGSRNSHVAILARSLGIPCILGVENLPVTQLEQQELIIDGYQGEIHIHPSKKLRQTYRILIDDQHELNTNLEQLRDLPAQTLDGHNISLWVNTGLAADTSLSLIAGAEGVGLYRTEIPFMNRDRFPGEEEQYAIYHQLLQAFAPRPVVMRTLDVGGDKSLPYFPVQEDNPFLGWRGIRITLDHPEIFLMQIRAMLRANQHLGNLRIMLPMITSLHEAEEALLLIKQAHTEILPEGSTIQMPLIGVMIEVPSAVYLAQALASHVDFLSVGSNDLTQYLLAVDRNNARVAMLYDSLHPAVLHALNQIVQAAHFCNKPVSICGEMASDPLAVPLLLAMGFDALSMNSSALSRIKWVIRNFTLQQSRKLLIEILGMDNAGRIRQHLENALCDAGLSQLVGPRK